MPNYVNDPQIPLGFGMALAQNSAAMDRFSGLPTEKKQAIIDGTHSIQSKAEMQAYVRSLIS